MTCNHNHRYRYTSGFYCEDCHTFFPKSSETYRSGEYMSTLWMALHNINATALQAGKREIPEVIAMRDKIDIGKRHNDYEQLITEAETLLAKHGSSAEAATVVIR